ncbi:unnamed protein product [Allacma fusca]|uniref:Uncharacterized protein n=1 Tax=Allacma fusca TaxID=39272 RepID=A0A8J2JBB4_9HEXA|nr:unnamed protein product [Allacma fusca]
MFTSESLSSAKNFEEDSVEKCQNRPKLIDIAVIFFTWIHTEIISLLFIFVCNFVCAVAPEISRGDRLTKTRRPPAVQLQFHNSSSNNFGECV